ncbi:unnamed protein product [Brassica rapa]|uniref:Uncharacterized protein n=1 Tax=Brassica campestris TaxID=3711 RepID=A0A3P6BF57_BRACM|nr:unnamed protein product [Brassica rapa]VDD00916.1 unnamed protein product [Brassica rapa]
MDEFGMGSPTEAFVLSGLDLTRVAGSFIRRISSSCCRNIMYSIFETKYIFSLYMMCLSSSPSFSILILLNPNQSISVAIFTGLLSVILLWTTSLILRMVQLKRVLSEHLR